MDIVYVNMNYSVNVYHYSSITVIQYKTIHLPVCPEYDHSAPVRDKHEK